MKYIDGLENKIDLAKRISLFVKSIDSKLEDIDYRELLKISEIYPELLLYLNDNDKIKEFLITIKDDSTNKIIEEVKINCEKNILKYIEEDDEFVYSGGFVNKKDINELRGNEQVINISRFNNSGFMIDSNKTKEFLKYCNDNVVSEEFLKKCEELAKLFNKRSLDKIDEETE